MLQPRRAVMLPRMWRRLAGMLWIGLASCGDDDASASGTADGESAAEATDASTTVGADSTSTTTETGSAEATTATEGGASTTSETGSTTSTDTSTSGQVDGSSSSSESSPECVGDEPEPHTTSDTAIELPGLDCDDPPLMGASVLDSRSGLDWYTFPGTDPDEGCEPESVRISVLEGGSVSVCAFASGCTATCTVGIPDGVTGCCGIDGVEFDLSCGPGDADDSASIDFLVGGGNEECQEVTFEYEF